MAASCFVCGRWDGSHSGGCPQTGTDYIGRARHAAARAAGGLYPCPTCKVAGKLTPAERRRGYQCADCTRRDSVSVYGADDYDRGW